MSKQLLSHPTLTLIFTYTYMNLCQNLVPLVNIRIAGKWIFIPLKMVLIGLDPYPYELICIQYSVVF